MTYEISGIRMFLVGSSIEVGDPGCDVENPRSM